MSKSKSIKITGARTHNLDNVSMEIPRDKMTAVTGPSGSGKTSLAVYTLFAEAQHRFLDTFSGYARQVLDLMDRPDVDSITGLSPAVCINQRLARGSPRSTAGTLSGTYDLLRLLFSQVGHRHSPVTGKRLHRHTVQEIVDTLIKLPENGERVKIQLMATVPVEKGRDLEELMNEYLKQGYIRFRVNGEMVSSEDYSGTKTPSRRLQKGVHNARVNSLEIVVDRLVMKSENADSEKSRRRLSDSVELALKLGGGSLLVNLPEKKEDRMFKNIFLDEADGKIYPDPTPGCFSFNSHEGACQACHGLGRLHPEKTMRRRGRPGQEPPEEEPTESGAICPDCEGRRLNRGSLAVTVLGLNIAKCCALSVSDLALWVARGLDQNPKPENDALADRELRIAAPILAWLQKSLNLLMRMGLSYLCLNRPANTLSGGELQRIRIAAQISAELSGVLYIFDEPSMGLHPADMANMLQALEELKNSGNTIVAVEHDSDTIKAADYVVEFGPEAGSKGGRIMFQGPPKKLLNTNTATGRYLGGKKHFLRREIDAKIKSLGLATPAQRPGQPFKLVGATCHNLKSVTVRIPPGRFIAVTGISGSGKSTLVHYILYHALTGKVNHHTDDMPVIQRFSKPEIPLSTVLVTQSPIGKSSRSNPATFTGMFESIRRLFAGTLESKIRGYSASRFSFNAPGGRCEICRGEGIQKVDMHFLNDITMRCDTCNGTRFNRDTLQIRFKGKNISEILDMTVDEASVFFRNFPRIRDRLKMLTNVGLGYLKLGQPGPSLSGGEAQRLKLAAELAKHRKEHTLYLLDEPSTGLHFKDIKKLLILLHSLVLQGNTVIVIEHQPDIILSADWIIDLGPGAGPDGGKIMAMGPLDKVLSQSNSVTAEYLKKYLE
jgi:excinuclease ABC subunit A